jgi:hypothetical protein
MWSPHLMVGGIQVQIPSCSTWCRLRCSGGFSFCPEEEMLRNGAIAFHSILGIYPWSWSRHTPAPSLCLFLFLVLWIAVWTVHTGCQAKTGGQNASLNWSSGPQRLPWPCGLEEKWRGNLTCFASGRWEGQRPGMSESPLLQGINVHWQMSS